MTESFPIPTHKNKAPPSSKKNVVDEDEEGEIHEDSGRNAQSQKTDAVRPSQDPPRKPSIPSLPASLKSQASRASDGDDRKPSLSLPFKSSAKQQKPPSTRHELPQNPYQGPARPPSPHHAQPPPQYMAAAHDMPAPAHPYLPPATNSRAHTPSVEGRSQALDNTTVTCSLKPPSSDQHSASINKYPLKPCAPYSRRFLGSTHINATYSRQTKLGEGTFGVVWKGTVTHSPLDNEPMELAEDVNEEDAELYHKVPYAERQIMSKGGTVALKKIICHNENDGMPITALREIRILKALSHPNIVPIVDIAFEDGDVSRSQRGEIYMVFPYMEHDLAGLLENQAVSLKLPEIKLFAQQLLQGVAYLHHNKILHRDIKAANLLISKEGLLQIADFGLARSLRAYDDKKPYTGTVVTRWYRSPELLLGERHYGTAVDMWGVGCIIGEMFKRKPIFTGNTDIDQVFKVFELCGTPDEASMPGYKDLPGPEGQPDLKWSPQGRRVKQEYTSLGSSLADLMDKLLVLNPKSRPSAEETLDHEWFWSDPLPTKVGAVSQFPSSHEYDRRKREKEAREQHAKRVQPQQSLRPPVAPQQQQAAAVAAAAAAGEQMGRQMQQMQQQHSQQSAVYTAVPYAQPQQSSSNCGNVQGHQMLPGNVQHNFNPQMNHPMQMAGPQPYYPGVPSDFAFAQQKQFDGAPANGSAMYPPQHEPLHPANNRNTESRNLPPPPPHGLPPRPSRPVHDNRPPHRNNNNRHRHGPRDRRARSPPRPGGYRDYDAVDNLKKERSSPRYYDYDDVGYEEDRRIRPRVDSPKPPRRKSRESSPHSPRDRRGSYDSRANSLSRVTPRRRDSKSPRHRRRSPSYNSASSEYHRTRSPGPRPHKDRRKSPSRHRHDDRHSHSRNKEERRRKHTSNEKSRPPQSRPPPPSDVDELNYG